MMTFWYKFGTIMVYVKNRKKVYNMTQKEIIDAIEFMQKYQTEIDKINVELEQTKESIDTHFDLAFPRTKSIRYM